jgi:hypothetical protein
MFETIFFEVEFKVHADAKFAVILHLEAFHLDMAGFEKTGDFSHGSYQRMINLQRNRETVLYANGGQ